MMYYNNNDFEKFLLVFGGGLFIIGFLIGIGASLMWRYL